MEWKGVSAGIALPSAVKRSSSLPKFRAAVRVATYLYLYELRTSLAEQDRRNFRGVLKWTSLNPYFVLGMGLMIVENGTVN